MPDASHYHRAGWARVIRNAFGREPLYRLVRRNGVVEGVLPLVRFASPVFGRFLVSIPFMNRGGVLARTPEARDALVDEAGALVRATRSSFCELRHVARLTDTLPAKDHKVSMSLPLTDDVDALWKGVGSKVRNLVRKAEKSGLTVRPGVPERDLDPFYDVFVENMRDLGTPVYTPRFFREVFREFPGDLDLTVVEGEGAVAAAGICIRHGGFTEIHWAASRRDMLKRSPNMLLYWECISKAARDGLTEFCFGRSTEDSGPYRFKKQWGAQPTRLHWEYVLAPGEAPPELNPNNPKYRLAIETWQKMPLWATRIVGPHIVRHLP
ncbi:FemAB family PEP-CTERM system-associated protein [bacterium]|nr:FemAB family PEP-CTERM system-associated protein [bacterium]